MVCNYISVHVIKCAKTSNKMIAAPAVVPCKHLFRQCLHLFSNATTATSSPKKHAVVERKINIKNGPPIHIVQTGQIAADGSPSPQKTLIMLCSIIGLPWTDFRSQLEGLPDLLPDWSFVTFDTPGRGKSQPPNRAMTPDVFENNAAAAASVMEALGVDRYSVLGYSGGGISGLALAALETTKVKKLITIGAAPIITQNLLTIFESK